MPRRHLFAGLAAILALAVPLAVGSVAAADPATQKQGARTVAVSVAADLPDTNAGLTVTGSGFDPTVDAYLAVCRADIAAADPLTACLGGPIPDENDTAGWALVSNDPEGKRNAAVFGEGGSFSVDLTLVSAVTSGVDCVNGGCVLIVRSTGDAASRPKDITIKLGFAAPSSSSSSASSTTSDAPATVGADTIALPDAYLGQQQTVVFTGFTPAEEVAVTVFSEPVTINGIVATAGGVVAITFPIGDALVPGVHTVQAVGRQSGLIGLATFTVVAAPVTSAASPSSSVASSSSIPSSSAESSAPSSAAAPSTTASAPVVTTAASTTSEPVTPATPTTSSTNLWWLWVTLALLVVAAGVGVAVVASRRRAQLLEQERLDRAAALAAADREEAAADAAAAAAAGAAGAWPAGTDAPYTSPADRSGYQPYDPGRSYDGLLSGRQGDGPSLYSGQGLDDGPTARQEPPTTWIDPEGRSSDLPTTAIRPDQAGSAPTPASTPPAEPPASAPPAEPPPTQRFDPNSSDPDSAAPRTEQWSPFGDEDEGGEGPPRR